MTSHQSENKHLTTVPLSNQVGQGCSWGILQSIWCRENPSSSWSPVVLWPRSSTLPSLRTRASPCELLSLDHWCPKKMFFSFVSWTWYKIQMKQHLQLSFTFASRTYWRIDANPNGRHLLRPLVARFINTYDPHGGPHDKSDPSFSFKQRSIARR